MTQSANPAALVTIQHFRDIPEALLAKGKLESAGIECLLADGNLVRMDWLLSNAIGGIRLQVQKQDSNPPALSWTRPFRRNSAKSRSGRTSPSRAVRAATRSTSALRGSTASGLMACGCYCRFRCPSARAVGSVIPAASSG